ncbi:hypothetical protein SMGES_28610 [Serratia marcescens]|nr:hypothetical protein SMGES_28610 [Serratia marcescens]
MFRLKAHYYGERNIRSLWAEPGDGLWYTHRPNQHLNISYTIGVAGPWLNFIFITLR